MKAIDPSGFANGFPATAVLRLTGDRPVPAPPFGNARADEVILAAVQHPPRTGEPRPIAALLPQVLARYGLLDSENAVAELPSAFDVTA